MRGCGPVGRQVVVSAPKAQEADSRLFALEIGSSKSWASRLRPKTSRGPLEVSDSAMRLVFCILLNCGFRPSLS